MITSSSAWPKLTIKTACSAVLVICHIQQNASKLPHQPLQIILINNFKSRVGFSDESIQRHRIFGLLMTLCMECYRLQLSWGANHACPSTLIPIFYVPMSIVGMLIFENTIKKGLVSYPHQSNLQAANGLFSVDMSFSTHFSVRPIAWL